jgi:hypothetical protein
LADTRPEIGPSSPGKGTLYWVEAKIIDALKPKEWK